MALLHLMETIFNVINGLAVVNQGIYFNLKPQMMYFWTLQGLQVCPGAVLGGSLVWISRLSIGDGYV